MFHILLFFASNTVYSWVFKYIFPLFCQLHNPSLFVTTHPCFSDNSFDKTVTHLDFYAFVKFLAGGRYGLSGAKLKVPELVLHSEEPEGKQRTDMFLTHIRKYSQS